LYEQATAAYKGFCTGKWPLETLGQNSSQVEPDVLLLAGASNIFAQRRDSSTADSPSGSTPSDSGTLPAIPQDTVHPVLLQYMQVIQDGDAEIQGSYDLLDTDLSRNTILSGGSSSGYGLGASTSAPVPHGMPGATCTNAGVLPTQPLPQVPADSQLWNSFESTQYPSGPGEAAYSLDSSPDFNSIFRFQVPSLHTQYPQLSSATNQTVDQTPTTNHSPTYNDLSRGGGVNGMRMGDTGTGSGLDFASFMTGNVPGLTLDGTGISWEAFLNGWNP